MSARNFASSLAAVLVHEGGYVNDPQDPGGATNRGVTQHVYDDWRRSQGLAPRGVRSLEQLEIEAIYRKLYWNVCHCDDLPAGVDYCVFDFAVNSGPVRAARYLQRAVGVADDGQIGPMTLAAANAKPPCETIAALSAARLDFLGQLPTFGRFGKGWTARVGEVGLRAAEMTA
jgi:lysozyme family protein